ncbi:DUF3152 domain-containing protein [Streptomyces sp. CB00455]|uniref:DUF3152 domain-containing protein n=1 Tax=Streptomyces sp. CB00455 TaxID=1703927 RepID=UPI00093A0C3F|nr:DUF3152 domain-containing protein [Streptomyces sp. CB00455]
MGRHSRKAPAPAAAEAADPGPVALPYEEPRVRRWPEPTVTHQGYAPEERSAPAGHPDPGGPGGARGAGSGALYGDWRGIPRARSAEPGAPAAAATAAPPAAAASSPAPSAYVSSPRPATLRAGTAPGAPAALLDTDTPAFGTPAVGFPQVVLAQPRATGPGRAHAPGSFPGPDPYPYADADADPYADPGPGAEPDPGPDPVTSTGSPRLVPAPREPADAPVEQPASGRGTKARTYAGMAAVAVATALAVVVAVHLTSENDSAKPGTLTAAGQGQGRSDTAASRSDGRPAPVAPGQAQAAAPELTYEQKLAQQLPIDEKLAGPGTFETVPGVAKAPGKGKLVRYRVDVEQGLGLDPQLFAEAVHRTLNDPRSWGHGDTKTFERVPGGEADFVITLASPGTTGVWCAKSGLDTTVDNVSCDSAATDRVMINAYRWAQGSVTYGPDQMTAYRQMLINHEVGHRLGHGHVSCRTPGALAPIMQQQTKSLDIDGIHCKPNPWVFPGS